MLLVAHQAAMDDFPSQLANTCVVRHLAITFWIFSRALICSLPTRQCLTPWQALAKEER